MQIMPVDHKPTDGFNVNAPQDLRPTMILGWLVDDDGAQRALVYSPASALWLAADGEGEAVPLPRADQMKITRLMTPTLRALGRFGKA